MSKYTRTRLSRWNRIKWNRNQELIPINQKQACINYCYHSFWNSLLKAVKKCSFLKMVGNFIFQIRVKCALLFVPILNTYALIISALSQHLYYCSCGRPSPSPACVPRDISTSCRPGAVCDVCVEAVFLVFMASAMTSRHNLTGHSENPSPREYSFRVLHILTINMLNKTDEFGVTQRRSRQRKPCYHAEQRSTWHLCLWDTA